MRHGVMESGRTECKHEARRQHGEKVVSFEDARAIVHAARGAGKRVAFTSGCFDILHVGHVMFLEECGADADILIIGVDDNATVGGAKGSDHPFFDETERVRVLCALEIVDYVFTFRGPCSADLLRALRPDTYHFSPYDPKHRQKTADAETAGVHPRAAGYDLKAWSSSRVGRTIRFGFLLESWKVP